MAGTRDLLDYIMTHHNLESTWDGEAYHPKLIKDIISKISEMKLSTADLFPKDANDRNVIHYILAGKMYALNYDGQRDVAVKSGLYLGVMQYTKTSVHAFKEAQYKVLHQLVDTLLSLFPTEGAESKEALVDVSRLFKEQDKSSNTVLHYALTIYEQPEQLTKMVSLVEKLSEEEQKTIATLTDQAGRNIFHLASNKPNKFMAQLVRHFSPPALNLALEMKTKNLNNVVAVICAGYNNIIFAGYDNMVSKLESFGPYNPDLLLETNRWGKNAVHIICENQSTNRPLLQHVFNRLTESKEEKDITLKYKKLMTALSTPDNDGRLPLHSACIKFNSRATQFIIGALYEILLEIAKKRPSLPDQASPQFRSTLIELQSLEQLQLDIFRILTAVYEKPAILKVLSESRTPLQLIAAHGNETSLEMMVNLLDKYQKDLFFVLRSKPFVSLVEDNNHPGKIPFASLGRISKNICIFYDIYCYLVRNEGSKYFDTKSKDFIACIQAIQNQKDIPKEPDSIRPKKYDLLITTYEGSAEYYEFRETLKLIYKLKQIPEMRIQYFLQFLVARCVALPSSSKKVRAERHVIEVLMLKLLPNHPLTQALRGTDPEYKTFMATQSYDQAYTPAPAHLFAHQLTASHPAALHDSVPDAWSEVEAQPGSVSQAGVLAQLPVPGSTTLFLGQVFQGCESASHTIPKSQLVTSVHVPVEDLSLQVDASSAEKHMQEGVQLIPADSSVNLQERASSSVVPLPSMQSSHLMYPPLPGNEPPITALPESTATPVVVSFQKSTR